MPGFVFPSSCWTSSTGQVRRCGSRAWSVCGGLGSTGILGEDSQWEKQEKLKAALERFFPKDRGRVFLPDMEWWRRGKNELERKRLFPGYVFIRSDMSVWEMHNFVSEHRSDVWTFVRELGIYEKQVSGEKEPERDAGDSAAYEIRDLTKEETGYLDSMLDEEGVIRMSAGYLENGRYVVMEGPLKAYEERIADVDRHNRIAYLDFQAMGRVAKAGMELLPKRHWYSEDQNAAVVLGDGTEVDVVKLKKRMMGG